MRIEKCRKEDVAHIGAFYDRVVLWLDNHINYPKWMYKGGDIVPGNAPAKRLYEKNGFRYAGTFDLERGIGHIPVFSLYELPV